MVASRARAPLAGLLAGLLGCAAGSSGPLGSGGGGTTGGSSTSGESTTSGGGQHEGGATSASTTGTTTGTGGAGGSGGAGGAETTTTTTTTTTGAGGAPPCVSPANCPGQDAACATRTCEAGVCGMAYAPSGAVCKQNGGQVCDGNGACVGCVDPSQCGGAACVNNLCQAPSCNDGAQNGGELGVDCGGPCPACPTVLVLAGGNAAALAAEWHPGGNWLTSTLPGVTVDGVALAFTGGSQALGLMRYTQLNNPLDNQLQFTTWIAGKWSSFAAIGANITTRGQPAIDASGGVAQVVFHGMDYKYYYAAWNGGWNPGAEPAGAPQSYGPAPATVAALGSDAVIVFHDGAANNAVSARARSGGAWQAGTQLGPDVNFNLAPVAVAMMGGPELMAVWVRNDGQLAHAVRSGGGWSMPSAIANAFSANRVALAALPGGEAALAFRGNDGKLYASFYAGGAWSAPAGVGNPAPAINGSPAITHGVDGATAELAYVGADGVARHTRYLAGAWTAPVQIGGAGLVSVAIAAAP